MSEYEGLFIFVRVKKDEELQKAIESAEAEITRLNGKVLAVEPVGKRTFARPMKNENDGHYVKLRFELEPDKVTALHGRYKLNSDVFRVQITRYEPKTVTEEAAAPAVAEAEDSAPAPVEKRETEGGADGES